VRQKIDEQKKDNTTRTDHKLATAAGRHAVHLVQVSGVYRTIPNNRDSMLSIATVAVFVTLEIPMKMGFSANASHKS
jgi:hypothetical protein